MATVGIICEYNPFHNGHKKQITYIRSLLGADTTVVCLMSGNYVQRGEPALFDKQTRAKAAVLCGADLVVELPVTAALSSAEGFAMRAVQIFEKLSGVDYLCFGSECGELQKIQQTAEALQTEQFSNALRESLQSGISYAAARQKALETLLRDYSAVTAPNDILAVEYCKALQMLSSKIIPLCIKRDGDYLDITPDVQNPSALSLRNLSKVQWREYLPPDAYHLFMDAPEYRMQNGQRAVLAVLRSLSENDFSNLPYGTEGLWRKLMHACQEGGSIEEIIEKTKSKRYARTRICRMLLCAYLGITKEQLAQEPCYVRILAANREGTAYLGKIRKNKRIETIHAGQTTSERAYYQLECRCAALYTLFCSNEAPFSPNTEKASRIYLKKI